MNETPLSTLLYRYFFFDWLLRDVRGATELERGLAAHHNRRAARWLPVYMLRWLWCTLLCWAAAGACDILLQEPELAGCLQAGAGLGALVLGVLVTAWVGLTQLSPQKTQ